VTARRLAAQQLSGPPARSPEEVVRRLLAVQAQDPRGARLSIRSRTAGLTAADVDDALTARRSLLVTWLNRGTLHLVTADDYWWLHPLTTPQLVTGNTRRLRQEGVGAVQADRGVEVVTDAVTAEGPQTRGALRVRLDAAGVPTGGQALVHVLLAASLRGHVVRGPMCGGEQAYVAVRDWLGEPPPPVDRDEALGRLARRYLAGHGPAGPRDLATWAGIPLGEARRGIRHIAAELVDVSAELAGPAGQDADPAGHGADLGELVDLADRAPAAGLPPPRLLGPFDPVLHGWASRGPIVGRHRQVVTSNGLFRATAFVGGRVVGTWGLAAGTLSLRLLEPVSAAALDALREDAADVLRFLGLPPRAVTVTSPG
jgi:hypothetical protein